MAFDYKKEYKELYLPRRTPGIVDVPPMTYVAVRGKGDPNDEDGAYKASIGLLYAVAYTVKMSKRGDHRIDGYFDFVVPPLEGFWWQEGGGGKAGTEGGAAFPGMDYSRKGDLGFVSAIRLPDFVSEGELAWAVEEASRKKGLDLSGVERLAVDEGLCVQCLHVGPYDDEPATVERMHEFARSRGYEPDFSDTRLHHEIYLSDPRRVAPERLRTVIRHPIREGRATSQRFVLSDAL